MRPTINRDPRSKKLLAACDRCGVHGVVYRWTAANREVLDGWHEFRICPKCFDALRTFLLNGRQKQIQRAAAAARLEGRGVTP